MFPGRSKCKASMKEPTFNSGLKRPTETNPKTYKLTFMNQ